MATVFNKVSNIIRIGLFFHNQVEYVLDWDRTVLENESRKMDINGLHIMLAGVPRYGNGPMLVELSSRCQEPPEGTPVYVPDEPLAEVQKEEVVSDQIPEKQPEKKTVAKAPRATKSVAKKTVKKKK